MFILAYMKDNIVFLLQLGVFSSLHDFSSHPTKRKKEERSGFFCVSGTGTANCAPTILKCLHSA